MRCEMTDTTALQKLLDLFFGYERQEIAEFRKAVEQFKTDLPAVLEALREHDRRRPTTTTPRSARPPTKFLAARQGDDQPRASARPTCARC